MLTYRVFQQDRNARAAVTELKAAGFPDALIRTASGADEGSVAALTGMGVSSERARAAAGEVPVGGALVAVKAPFGAASRADGILSRARDGEAEGGPSEFEVSYAAPPGGEAAPLSDFLGIPVLSREAAPLSKAVGMTVLAASQLAKRESFGMPTLSAGAAPLSSAIGLPARSGPAAPLSRLFGLPTLSKAAAPLSGAFGVTVLSDQAAPLSRRAGWTTLLSDPAPLSRALGLPVLIRSRARR